MERRTDRERIGGGTQVRREKQEKQAERQTERKTGRKTDRKEDRKTDRYGQAHSWQN